MRKGVSPLISYFLAIGIAISGITIVLNAGVPALDQIQTARNFDQFQGTFSNLDQTIQEIASEGPGSQRVTRFDIPAGRFRVDQGKAKWSLQMENKVIEPRTIRRRGDLLMFSNVNVNVTESDDYYILENSILKVWIQKIGSESNPQSINASNLVQRIENKEEGVERVRPFRILPDNSPAHEYGSGYTEPVRLDKDLGSGTLTANILSSKGLDYQVNFTLETGSDFLVLESDLT